MLSSSCRIATVCCLLLPVRLASRDASQGAAQAAAAPESCVFAGAVYDSVSKQPLAKASVDLGSRSSGAVSWGTITDAAGAFRFETLPAGDYVIRLSARGYSSATAVSLKPGQPTSWLHFTAGQSVTGAVAALDPPAVVSGRVTDADGEPISGAHVEALVPWWQRGIATLQTLPSEANERGEYRLRLEPGRYFLSAGPPGGGPRAGGAPFLFTDGPGQPETIVASVVYPDAPSTEGATEFDLHPGQQLGGIDFKLPTVAAYHVRGSLRPAVELRNGQFLFIERRDGGRLGLHSAIVKNGAFDFPGVPPGSYWLRVTSFNAGHVSGKAPVDVTDRDVNGVILDVIPPLTLKGRVRLDVNGPQSPPQVPLRLHLLDWSFFPYNGPAHTKPDGSFQFEDVPAGEFAMELDMSMVAQGDLYVESVSYNHREAPGGKLDLSSGAAGELEVVLGSGTGQVSGTVHWPDALPGTPPPAPAANLAAVAARADGVTGNTGLRRVEIDQQGRFQFSGLPPGRYFVWAVTHFDEGHWQNMEFVTEMQSRGVAVDLPKKGSVQVDISEVIE